MIPTPAQKPELLAPAGSLDVFATAVDEGADAVYIGAPELNARALARNFTPEELAAMIDYGHRAGVKVYLAMNSLVKEEEIDSLVELLALLEGLGPDALIIQDLGLAYLVRKYFPSLVLHASTLMAAHNSLAVRQFADMGFKRVVLAREMTLEEIRVAHESCPVELEAFVHGALCFSYSGLCLFSSYLGGRSGLRGRCVQPCRRRYSWAGPGRGHRSGYFFSMNDLEAVGLLPRLAAAGISSFKIEGRMRSANYVGSVVKAYRLAIDAGDELGRVLGRVEELLHQAMGRRSTSGYFLSPRPDDAITPFHSGNIGHFLGRIHRIEGDLVSLTLQEGVDRGDRIRVHREASGERASFTLKSVTAAGSDLSRGEKDETVSLLMPGIEAQPGDSLYRVDVKERRRMETRGNRLQPARFQKLVSRLQNRGRAAKVKGYLALHALRPVQMKKPRGRSRPDRTPGLPVWLRADDLRLLQQPPLDKPDRLVLTLDRETFLQYGRRKKSRRRFLRSLTWALPSVIFEEDVGFYRRAVGELMAAGCRNWLIGHVGQLALFSERPPAAGRGGTPPPPAKGRPARPFLAGDYTLNVMNSLALRLLAENGVSTTLLAIESDRENIARLCLHKKKSGTGLVVYGRPPLFTARLKPEFFQFHRSLVSPKGERFILEEKRGQTFLLADSPFSLLGQLDELGRLGLDFAVIDLSWQQMGKKELAGLRRRLGGQGNKRSRSGFNFFRSLA